MKRNASLKSLACLLATLAASTACLSFVAAARAEGPQTQSSAGRKAAVAAEHIQVQHILIGFTGSIPGKDIKRTPKAAQKLAETLVKSIKSGANFDSLVKKYTEDQYPGIYGLANTGIPPAQGEFPRSGMVKGFGDTAFSLKLGEVGLCRFDSVVSPYGYHIIKRLK